MQVRSCGRRYRGIRCAQVGRTPGATMGATRVNVNVGGVSKLGGRGRTGTSRLVERSKPVVVCGNEGAYRIVCCFCRRRAGPEERVTFVEGDRFGGRLSVASSWQRAGKELAAGGLRKFQERADPRGFEFCDAREQHEVSRDRLRELREWRRAVVNVRCR